jgi:hypothetical protein
MPSWKATPRYTTWRRRGTKPGPARQVRKFAVNGDELVIKTTPRTAGIDTRQFVNTLTWERTEVFPLLS